ncbi:MAG: 3-oxoacyl-(acyl-carrier-protein) synthase 2 [Chloroflexi bacterium]|nr:3-oxoacyl-(acyl-carrier-protein) synthase 2 [Chloroflexota bacterium]MDB5076263.1 3-oxoacyl-(acyl-carrier-protein) synthase 2 [Chloroflexota bacterium]
MSDRDERAYDGRTRRVAITGIGAVTPIGSGRAGLWAGVTRGASAVDSISRFDPSPFSCQVAAEVRDFAPRDHLPHKLVHRLDRYAQFAVTAAIMAMTDGKLDPATLEDGRAGVYLGSALGGVAGAEAEHVKFMDGGLRAVNPLLALSVFGASASTNVSMHLGLTGPCVCNANGCAAGAIAVGEAFQTIRRGELDVAFAGGAEAPLMPLTFGAFAAIRAMSTRNDEPSRASRPFDRDRDGFVMGEGAAILLLEEWDHAVRRGASPLAEVVGFSQTCDAYRMTAPLPDGRQAARAIRQALADAGIGPDAIEYVKAHGSATPLNDPTETLAIRLGLGPQAERVPVSATKGLHAHALGASGAIEAAIVAIALESGYIPATANLENLAPDCDLDFVQCEGRVLRPRYALCNSFGFGGINAALVLRSMQ